MFWQPQNLLTTSFEVYLERTNSTFDVFNAHQSSNIARVFPHRLVCDGVVPGRCVTANSSDTFYIDDNHPSPIMVGMIVELLVQQIKQLEQSHGE